MRIDPSRFHLGNITDTCSVWNVLSSSTLYRAAISAKCVFACTACVLYECLHKRRKVSRPEDGELQRRLEAERESGRFQVFSPSLEDVQDPRVLAMRERLGKGELSVIALALGTGQAMMTDDQGARAAAEELMESDRVQTTPHLFGWLLFDNHLGDCDKGDVTREHEELRASPLTRWLDEMYRWSLQCRLSAGGRED